ncbi:MAG: hypothetical protein JW862_14200 [Anaerolineales bacterium]|nr:hypothetical protein [Anaerolineales bacterium]
MLTIEIHIDQPDEKSASTGKPNRADAQPRAAHPGMIARLVRAIKTRWSGTGQATDDNN